MISVDMGLTSWCCWWVCKGNISKLMGFAQGGFCVCGRGFLCLCKECAKRRGGYDEGGMDKER